MLNSAIVLASEAALALYPILIKTVSVNLSTQLVSRFLIYTIAGLLFAKSGTFSRLWGGSQSARTSGLGLITLAHVFTSYYAFHKLPAGISMSLFYTYPIWNLLGGYLLFGEIISFTQSLLVGLALVGVVLVSIATREDTLEEGIESEQKGVDWAGIMAGLGAALTETIMYFAVRTAHVTDPFSSMVELYSGALFGMIALALLGSAGVFGRVGKDTLKIGGSLESWMKMGLFNACIGFVGYALRFYAIPKMSTLAFSMLSLVGVVASFIWGLVFVSEVPSWMSLTGGALIAAAAAFTDRRE